MQIISGRWKGKKLISPSNKDIRPTLARVKENIFNILSHAEWFSGYENIAVLDLFAGTGQMGLESLSKGAKWCMFVEQSPQSRAIIRQNIELLQVQGISKVYSRSAIDMGEMQSNSKGPFQLIFCDAPYYQDLSRQALDSAANGHWLANNAICVVETEKENRNMQLNENFFLLDTRQYADCLIYFVKYKIS